METVDPKTGLTRKEKDAVRDSWTQLASDWKVKGPDFFIRYGRSSNSRHGMIQR